MYRHNTDVFEKFKNKQEFEKKDRYHAEIYFQIAFDSFGAFLKIVDERSIEIDPDPQYYKNEVGKLIKLIKSLKNSISYNISWELTENKIYLSKNTDLIPLLLKVTNVVNSRLRPLRYVEIIGKTYLVIDGTGKLESRIYIEHDSENNYNVSFISDKYVLADDKIIEIRSLGLNFFDIHHFETEFRAMDLEKFLSLLYSRFDNIAVNYYDYEIVDDDIKKITPALIFEKIDDDNNLIINLSRSLTNFNSDFLENYQLNKVLSVNDITKTINVSEIAQIDLQAYFDELEKILNKYKKSIQTKNNFHIYENTFILEENLAREFVYKELHYLISRFTIFGTEKLKPYNVKMVTPKLNLSLNHGIDFLEGDASLEIEGEIISLNDIFNSYSKNSYVILKDGTNAIINKVYLDKLKRIFKRDKDKIKISFFDLPIVEELIDEKIASDFFKHSRDIFLGFNKISEQIIDIPVINAKLRPYQEMGYKWIKYLYENSLGGCLADDMGLGKTIQTITMLSSIYPQEQMSTLIVMPKSLLFNWENEINKFNPELTYYTYYGANRSMKEAKTKHLIITTYAMLRNEIEKFRLEEFFYIVLDESQNIKNSNSQVSRAVMLIKAKHKLSLSGTPIENNLNELYSLFRFLNPAMFGSQDEFNKYYSTPIQKDNDKEVAYELKKKIYPFILRRLKKDVLKELPDKIEQTLYIEMSPEQKEFYEQRRLFYYKTVKEQIATTGVKKSQFYILQALSELRQIASIPESKSENTIISPKREVLIENILDVIANDHKVLVFANFLNALDHISDDLEKHGIKHLLMTGSTKDRRDLIEKFQNDASYKVFLMTLKTGGLGLNLTAADYIFIFDPWWNKSAENQAVDRAHRIGQDKTVFSYKMITKGTIEEKILQLQERKIELFDSIISHDSSSMKSLDEKDVEFILGS
ncbi:MAG: DEAD/DEAH box helicase [Candidatus Sericytochromatia bacterium]|nr:DEAD/DEAH box helicase [Candidatus Sericytochromatia bacterium]